MKIGTVEPKYTDVWLTAAKEMVLDGENGHYGSGIMDDALAFIYGAIAKYAWRPTYLKDEEYRKSLKDYILREAEHIGENLYSYEKGKEPIEDNIPDV